MSRELLWYASRAGGLAAITLMTITLMIGTWGPIRRQERTGRTARLSGPVMVGVHRTLSLATVCFIAAHILTAIVDSFVDISWLASLIPFTSAYKSVPVALGTISLDLAITVSATALLRQRIPRGWWRPIHKAAYALWPLAGVHALLLSGSEPALIRGGITALIGIGTFAVARRLLTADAPTTGASYAKAQPQQPEFSAPAQTRDRLWSAG